MESRRPRIALSLSGGGFRATFFHLGVIRFLAETGLLKDVNQICSVSGGSILAAHLVKNWSDYTGDSKLFEEIAGRLIKFGTFDLRGRIIRRWLLSFLFFPVRIVSPRSWSRTDMLKRYYDERLFRGETLRTLKDTQSGPIPRLHILATSFKLGAYAHLTAMGCGSTTARRLSFSDLVSFQSRSPSQRLLPSRRYSRRLNYPGTPWM